MIGKYEMTMECTCNIPGMGGIIFLDYSVVATSADEAQLRAKLRYGKDPLVRKISSARLQNLLLQNS